MSNKLTAEKIAASTGRKAVLMATFESTEDFDAVTRAETFMFGNGYKIGSMCRNDPMACSKNVKYIAKWSNIDIEDYSMIEAVIVSEDMRNGPVVECYEFV